MNYQDVWQAVGSVMSTAMAGSVAWKCFCSSKGYRGQYGVMQPMMMQGMDMGWAFDFFPILKTIALEVIVSQG